MCQVLEVPRSSYYAWRKRPPSARERENDRLLAEIREIHAASNGNYGSPRIHDELQERGWRCGRKRVARLMREAGLVGQQTRAWHPTTTQSDPGHTVAPDHLQRDFSAERPDEKWVSDITYIETAEGWLYLTAILDLYSRRVIGWSMADHLRTELVLQALEMALACRGDVAGVIHHSDRGTQYTSHAFQDRLHAEGILPSMGRTGDCYDNAVAESFFATLKVECVQGRVFTTRQTARTAIFKYIETFYNKWRSHSTLDYASPIEFESQYEAQSVACTLI